MRTPQIVRIVRFYIAYGTSYAVARSSPSGTYVRPCPCDIRCPSVGDSSHGCRFCSVLLSSFQGARPWVLPSPVTDTLSGCRPSFLWQYYTIKLTFFEGVEARQPLYLVVNRQVVTRYRIGRETFRHRPMFSPKKHPPEGYFLHFRRNPVTPPTIRADKKPCCHQPKKIPKNK